MPIAQALQNLQGVAGPAVAVDNAIARFDGTTGKKAQSSNVTIDDTGNIVIGSIIAGVADYDKFIVSDSGQLKYRTGAEVLSDIGAATSLHLHDGDTLQLDGINSDGGAFACNTTGDWSFNQNVLLANSKSIGIGPAAERLEFYTAGYAAFMGYKVGIGIATPLGDLHIKPAGGAELIVQKGSGSTESKVSIKHNNPAGYGVELVVNDAAGDFRIDAISNGAKISNAFAMDVSTANISLTATGDYGGLRITNTDNNTASRITMVNDTGKTSSFNQYSSGTGHGLANAGGFGTQNNIIIYSDAGVSSGGTNSIEFRTGGYGAANERMRIDSNGNILVATTTAPASMTKGLALANGVIPTGNVANQFSMYSADQVAGNACPHIRTENGAVIKLHQAAKANYNNWAALGDVVNALVAIGLFDAA